MSKPLCYVASPCGFAESTTLWYRRKLLPALRKYVVVKDPWGPAQTRLVREIESRPVNERYDGWISLGKRHYDTISKCAMLVAVLDQEPPDNGTVCEVVFASAQSIPVIGYRNDARTSGESGVTMNLMILTAIYRSGGCLTSGLKELLTEVRARV
jgi:nucleoside 2-deoxyribosyltransferase